MAPRSPPQTQMIFKVELTRLSRIGAMFFVCSLNVIKRQFKIFDLNADAQSNRCVNDTVELLSVAFLSVFGESH